jgi:hypothetical protein
MKNPSLDAEPPSRFEGKKEVNKKKNQLLIVLLKNEKSKRGGSSVRNLERDIKEERQKYSLNTTYLNSKEESYKDNQTFTRKTFEFTSTLNINKNQIDTSFDYVQKSNSLEFPEKKFQGFYGIISSYSFIPKIKEEKREEEMQNQSKEHESEESFYLLYKLDEETEGENTINIQ